MVLVLNAQINSQTRRGFLSAVCSSFWLDHRVHNLHMCADILKSTYFFLIWGIFLHSEQHSNVIFTMDVVPTYMELLLCSKHALARCGSLSDSDFDCFSCQSRSNSLCILEMFLPGILVYRHPVAWCPSFSICC